MKRHFLILVILCLGALCGCKDSTNHNNKIYYTSSNGDIVELYSKHPFGKGVSIVSNVYENGQGVITCSGDITTIGKDAFNFRNNLTSITIPDSVTAIGESAFEGCGHLTKIIIPNSVTVIGDGAFCQCFSLTSIAIPNSVTIIGHRAFCECFSLTSITIPESVTTIGFYAFAWIKNLKSIYCEAVTPPSLDREIITNDAIIYVPEGSVEAYKTAYGWKSYADRIKVYDF